MTQKATHQPASLGIIGFMVAAVLFAGISGVLLSQLLENKYAQEPLKPIVVLNKDVPAGVPLQSQDLRLTNWPQSAIPKGAFISIPLALKSKQIPLVSLTRGEPLLASHLSRPNAGFGIASLISKGKRAMAIRTGDPVTLSRLVYPGATVDVLSTIPVWAKSGVRQVKTRIVLQKVTVLAVGEDIDPLTISRRKRAALAAANNRGTPFNFNASDSKEVRGIVTLMVTPQEAEQLTLAARDGKIDIALRNPSDPTKMKTSGITRQTLLGDKPDGKTQTISQKSPDMVNSRGITPITPTKRIPRPRIFPLKRHKRDELFTQKAKTQEAPSVRIYRGGK